MSNARPYIIKDHPDVPDSYGIKIKYITGREEEFDGTHIIIDKTQYSDGTNFQIMPNNAPFIQILTLDDRYIAIPLGSIEKIEFDKRYSEYVALKSKIKEKQNEKPN